MKKTKRILALTGAVILLGLYISTLIFALTDHSGTMDLLMASIACTIILPVLLYAYTLVYRIARRQDPGQPDCHDEDSTPSDNSHTTNDQT